MLSGILSSFISLVINPRAHRIESTSEHVIKDHFSVPSSNLTFFDVLSLASLTSSPTL